MTDTGHPTRRTVIKGALLGAGAIGLGGAAGYLTTRRPRETDLPAKPTHPTVDLDNNLWARYATIDPALITWRTQRRIETGVERASCVAVADDHLVVAGRSVRRFDFDGRALDTFTLPAAAHALHVDRSGMVHVATRDTIQRFDPSGKALAPLPLPMPSALITALHRRGDHWLAADAATGLIHQCDDAFVHQRSLGCAAPDRDTDSFHVPSPYFDLAVADDGVLWVAHPGRQRLEAYDADHQFLRAWGSPSMKLEGFCGCCNPCHFALLGRRFVTCEKGLRRVKIYRSDGSVETVVAGPDTFAPPDADAPLRTAVEGKAIDVAVLGTDRIALLDTATAAVHIMARNESA